jgi:hypothetical protein
MKGGSLRSFKYVPLLAVLSVAARLTVGVTATRPTSSRRRRATTFASPSLPPNAKLPGYKPAGRGLGLDSGSRGERGFSR